MSYSDCRECDKSPRISRLHEAKHGGGRWRRSSYVWLRRDVGQDIQQSAFEYSDRWRRACRAYADGSISKAEMEAAGEEYTRTYDELERLNEYVAALANGVKPPSGLLHMDAYWRLRWHRERTAELERAERHWQKEQLREGHRTLTALRRHLRNPGRSPLLESKPAKTSPT